MTDPATGALSKLVLGFEDVAFGTVATVGFEMPFVKSTLKATRNKIPSKVLRGNFNPGKPSNGRVNVAGQIVVPMCSKSLWYWYKLAFNTLLTSGTDPYVHEFKMTGVTKRLSATIEHQFLDLATEQYVQYTGCKINGISFSVGEEGEKLVNLDIVGIKETYEVSSFDAAPTDAGYDPLDETDSTLEEGGSAIGTSITASANIGFNMDTSKYFIGGGGNLGALPDNKISVKGNMDFMFDSMTLLNKAKNSTETSMKNIFSRAADKKVEMFYPEVMFGENTPTIDGPEGIIASLPWEGYYDNATEESSVVATITNSEAHA